MSVTPFSAQAAISFSRIARDAFDLMRASGNASLINVASIMGHRGLRQLAGYSATKGAVSALTRALAENNRVIIEAPTGSGKSTQVPQMVLDSGAAGPGEVVVLQPRRLAARLLAKRVAFERGALDVGNGQVIPRERAFVMRGQQLVGIITESDILTIKQEMKTLIEKDIS